jgi:hypothetical protein
MLRFATLSRAKGPRPRAGYWLLGVAVPALAVLVYALVLVLKLPQFYFANIAWNSDLATFMLLSKTIAQGMPGTVYTTYTPYYSTMIIDILTYHLPDHQFLWMAWPLAAYMATVGALALTVSHLVGRWAALMTAILCLAPSPLVLLPIVAQAVHGLTVINCILLAAFLDILVVRGTRTTPTIILAAAGLGIFSGINAASDFLVVLIGLIPFLGVTLVLLARYRDGSALRTVSVCLGILAIATIADSLTYAASQTIPVIPHPLPVGLIPPNALPAHLDLSGGIVWEEIAAPWQYTTHAVGWPEFLLAMVTLGTIVTAGTLLLTRVFSARRLAASPRARALEAHYLIWIGMAAANFAAISLTFIVYDLWAVRYAVILWVAGAATVPLLFTLSRVRRVGFALVVTALVAIHAGAVYDTPTRADPGMTATVAYLESLHIRHGYADYSEANATTWVTQGILTLRPAMSCGHAGMLCRTNYGSAAAWYAPQPGWSAVIVDPRHALSVPPGSLYGPPREIHHVGQLTIYVYDHDLGPLPSHLEVGAPEPLERTLLHAGYVLHCMATVSMC